MVSVLYIHNAVTCFSCYKPGHGTARFKKAICCNCRQERQICQKPFKCCNNVGNAVLLQRTPCLNQRKRDPENEMFLKATQNMAPGQGSRLLTKWLHLQDKISPGCICECLMIVLPQAWFVHTNKCTDWLFP